MADMIQGVAPLRSSESGSDTFCGSPCCLAFSRGSEVSFVCARPVVSRRRKDLHYAVVFCFFVYLKNPVSSGMRDDCAGKTDRIGPVQNRQELTQEHQTARTVYERQAARATNPEIRPQKTIATRGLRAIRTPQPDESLGAIC